METQVLEATARGAIEGVILRYGMFYGLETPSTAAIIDMVRKRRLPVVRGDAGQLPVIHVDDAVSATERALDAAPPGATYDIVDGQAGSFTEIVDAIAEYTGLPTAQSAGLAARLVAPYMARMTTIRMPLSNARAKADLGWRPSMQRCATGWRICFDRRRERWSWTSSTPIGLCCFRLRRMLGSASDAEDVLQDAWLRCRSVTIGDSLAEGIRDHRRHASLPGSAEVRSTDA
jgi:hypothetical protein